MTYGNGTRAGRPILENVELSVPEAQFLCVLGPSGCGKTTLLNLMAGFLHPTAGEILFDGHPVTGPGPERGVVFQDAVLFPWLTAIGNVEFGLLQRDLKRPHARRLALDYLGMVGMTDEAHAYPYTLSGGMRQRVAIARVLALEPAALLMDEPFSALDANTREHLQDELLRIWMQHQRTVVYVTHSVEEAAYLGDRVVVLAPAPGSMCADLTISVPRPRQRRCDELNLCIQTLRRALDQLPCCTKPRLR